MNKLDELRRLVALEQQERAAARAAVQAEEAAADAALEVAVREDLPKWTKLLEAALKRKVDSCRMELVYTPASQGGLFSSNRPARMVVKVWPSIDVGRLRSDERRHIYASRITSQLGHPFKLAFDESSEYSPDSFSLTWL